MKTPYQLLKELLPLIESFVGSRASKDFTIESFNLWLTQQMTKSPNRGSTPPQQDFQHSLANIDSQILHSILYMNRSIKMIAKKALAETDLISMDDFHFLVMLQHKQSMKKSELIYSNLLEMPSGIEVINRLIKNDYIEDFADPDDKRSKRVKITSRGEKLVLTMMEKMNQVYAIVLSKLDHQQKIVLLALLKPLIHFHTALLKQEKNCTFEELRSRIIDE